MACRMVDGTMTAPFRRILMAAVLIAAPLGAKADPHDHDLVRRAVERGEIRPLAEIREVIRNKLPGKIVRTEVEQKHGRWVYEFRVVDERGRLFEVYVDAHTGEIGAVREK
jgi:uncharacterized membrane protein YkoI